jgi:hypothetical protein
MEERKCYSVPAIHISHPCPVPFYTCPPPLAYKFHFYFFKERTSWEIRSYRNQDGVGNYNGDSSLVLPLLGLGQGTWGDSWILRGKEKVVGLCSFLHGHESRPRLSFPEAPTVMSIPYHWHVSQHSKDCRSAWGVHMLYNREKQQARAWRPSTGCRWLTPSSLATIQTIVRWG